MVLIKPILLLPVGILVTVLTYEGIAGNRD
jgi:hypothetical protein